MRRAMKDQHETFNRRQIPERILIKRRPMNDNVISVMHCNTQPSIKYTCKWTSAIDEELKSEVPFTA